MEFKVWVEGIQRVICGVTEDTTCHDVVIALAHATGRTGRFKLTEKWRENERLVPPNECPLKLLRSWGEYAGDVQYMLKCSGENSMRSSGKMSCQSLRNEEKFSNRVTRQQVAPHSPLQNRANIKRNLTFSGAHQSNLLTPSKGRAPKKPPLPPFENSSLDSVEEQSSISSHSSSSPYSSFQSASSTRRNGELIGLSHIQERPHYDHFEAGFPAATSSAFSTPVTSPKVKGVPHTNGDVCSDSSPVVQDCQVPSFGHHNDNTDSHADLNSYRNGSGVSSQNSHFQPPKVLSQSMGVKEMRMRFFNGGNSHVDGHHPDTTAISKSSKPRNNSDNSSHSALQSNGLGSGMVQPKHSVSQHTDQKGFHSPIQSLEQQNQNGALDKNGDVHFSRHSNNSNHVSNQNHNSTTLGMHLNPRHMRQNSSDFTVVEPDENWNSKKDLSALLEDGDFKSVCREDLVRLVNFQIERLNAQEEQLKQMEAEILVCNVHDLKEASCLDSLSVKCVELIEQEQLVAEELEELELVSWEEKLEREQRQGGKLREQLETLQETLSRYDTEVSGHEDNFSALSSSLEIERSLCAKHESEAKEKEYLALQEVSDLQDQINQSLLEHDNNEKTLQSLDTELKQLESGLQDKTTEISDFEKELKETNLQVFVLKPMVNNNNPGVSETVEKSQHPPHSSESSIPFTRSLSSRAGSARKIPSTAMALKDALESEPQGYWV